MTGLWAGCQDEDAFSLSAASVGLGKNAEAKDAIVASCSDVPRDEAVIRAMLEAVNAERAKHQLPALRLDDTLCDIADFYACRLVEGGFFAHEDPFDGSTVDVRAANFGYAFQKIGENLAAGQRSVEQAMNDWMASPEHRQNILDPAYTDIGIGVKLGGECGIYWVQEFGHPIVGNGEATTSRAADREPPADSENAATTKPGASTAPAASQKSDAAHE